MKKIFTLLTLIYISSIALSQYVNYENDKGWKLGFNFGGTWQDKENVYVSGQEIFVKRYAGFSGGFTFGKALYEKEDALFSFDLRVRYLAGCNFGWLAEKQYFQVSSALYDSVEAYRNYKMTFYDWSLEGVLTLNKLRQETGIILYGFGGLGIVGYRVESDYLDAGFLQNNPYIPYDYSSLSSTSLNDYKQIGRELKRLSDKEFESVAPNTASGTQVQLMPSLGIGLGYQITEKFSIGLEHKITFARHDNLDGGLENGKNDRYHYTAFNFKFNLFSGSSNGHTGSSHSNHNDYSSNQQTNTNQQTTTNTATTTQNNNTPTGNKPLVNITNPDNNSTIINTNTFNFKANLYYVKAKEDIIIKHNGYQISNFTYNLNTGTVEAPLNLALGKHIFEITGKNDFGSDYDKAEIVYELKAPIVNITSPNVNPKNTNNSNASIIARVYNVNSKQNIRITINGHEVPNFTYNINTNELLLNTTLIKGSNVILIHAQNQVGTASDNTTIIYAPIVNCDKPIITYISPRYGNANSNSNTYNMKVKVTGVLSANDININKDGFFKSIAKNYNTNTGELSATLNLEPGPNTFIISANNECGKTTTNISITYRPIVPCNKPTISLNAPNSASYTTKNSKGYIEMKLTDAKTFEYRIEGQNSSAYEYSSSTGIFKSLLHLKRGINNFELTAINDCGITNQKITINYLSIIPCDKPIITYISPANGSDNSNSNTYNMKVKITGILSAKDININKDGLLNKTIKNYNTSTGELSATLNLESGLNNFVISANNACGKTTINISITYTPIEPPQIILSTPSSFPHQTSNQQIDIIGRVENVNSKSDIEVLIDETPTSFTFNTVTRQIDIPIDLNIGNNILKIEAHNTAGNDRERVNLIRTGPPPVIHLTNRSENTSLSNPEIINVATFSVLGYVSEFDSVSFEVKDLNGSNNINYNYIASNGVFRIMVNINNNQLINLEIKASNNFGTDIMNLYLLRGIVSNSGNNSNSSGNNNGKTINTNTVQSKTDYNKMIQKADMYYNARKWSEAKTYYQKALSHKPTDSYAKSRITTIDNKLKSNTVNKTNSKTSNSSTKTNNTNSSKTNSKTSNSSSKTKSSSNSKTENNNNDTKNTKSSNNNSKTSKTNTSTNKETESKVKTNKVNKTEKGEDQNKTKIRN